MSKGPVLRLLVVVSLLGGLLVGMAPSAHAAYFCLEKRATKVGTAADNTIYGTARADVVVGRVEATPSTATAVTTRLTGDEGNDNMIGDNGNDTVEGSPGADVVHGKERFVPAAASSARKPGGCWSDLLDPLNDSHLRANPRASRVWRLRRPEPNDLRELVGRRALPPGCAAVPSARDPGEAVADTGCVNARSAFSAPGGLRRLRVVRALGLRFMLTFQIAIDSGKDLRRIVQPTSWFPR